MLGKPLVPPRCRRRYPDTPLLCPRRSSLHARQLRRGCAQPLEAVPPGNGHQRRPHVPGYGIEVHTLQQWHQGLPGRLVLNHHNRMAIGMSIRRLMHHCNQRRKLNAPSHHIQQINVPLNAFAPSGRHRVVVADALLVCRIDEDRRPHQLRHLVVHLPPCLAKQVAIDISWVLLVERAPHSRDAGRPTALHCVGRPTHRVKRRSLIVQPSKQLDHHQVQALNLPISASMSRTSSLVMPACDATLSGTVIEAMTSGPSDSAGNLTSNH